MHVYYNFVKNKCVSPDHARKKKVSMEKVGFVSIVVRSRTKPKRSLRGAKSVTQAEREERKNKNKAPNWIG